MDAVVILAFVVYGGLAGVATFAFFGGYWLEYWDDKDDD